MTAPAGPNARAKRELRRQVIGRRDALSADDRRRCSRRICRRVARSPEFQRAKVALLFANFGSEVDTAQLLQAALATGKRLVLPRVHAETRTLELRAVDSLDDGVAPGTWGIPEPLPGRCPEVSLASIDFVLVPGVAFDRELRRLGYGGGYYDRILAGLGEGTAVVAICFEAQMVPSVPADPHDLRVPVLITENERIERP